MGGRSLTKRNPIVACGDTPLCMQARGAEGKLPEAPTSPPVILSERVGAGVGAKDRRTNPGVDPQARRRKVGPHPRRDWGNCGVTTVAGRGARRLLRPLSNLPPS